MSGQPRLQHLQNGWSQIDRFAVCQFVARLNPGAGGDHEAIGGVTARAVEGYRADATHVRAVGYINGVFFEECDQICAGLERILVMRRSPRAHYFMDEWTPRSGVPHSEQEFGNPVALRIILMWPDDAGRLTALEVDADMAIGERW